MLAGKVRVGAFLKNWRLESSTRFLGGWGCSSLSSVHLLFLKQLSSIRVPLRWNNAPWCGISWTWFGWRWRWVAPLCGGSSHGSLHSKGAIADVLVPPIVPNHNPVEAQGDKL